MTLAGWRDSWYHYRHQMRMPWWYAVYRTWFYETKHREPWA